MRFTAYASLAKAMADYSPHGFFQNKAQVTARMQRQVTVALRPFADVIGLQLLRTDVPQEFEAAMMGSGLAKLAIVQMEKTKARRTVELRTLRLIASYASVATVALASGDARAVTQRAQANAAMTRQTVEAELHAFANVTEGLGGRRQVTAHDILDYAYWQLVVGDTAPQGVRQRLPLHDMLIGGNSPAR